MIVESYIKNNISRLDSDYHWSMPQDIPADFGVTIDATHSLADQACQLRHQLAARLQNFPATAEQIVPWYISVWGGVRGNRTETLREYIRQVQRVLAGENIEDWVRARGMQGIASWSKALSLSDPSRYAILDARVIMTMNVLLADQEEKFPWLPSRNKVIVQAQRNFKTDTNRRLTYENYLETLRRVSGELPPWRSGHQSSLCQAEMILFAHAEKQADVFMASLSGNT